MNTISHYTPMIYKTVCSTPLNAQTVQRLEAYILVKYIGTTLRQELITTSRKAETYLQAILQSAPEYHKSK